MRRFAVFSIFCFFIIGSPASAQETPRDWLSGLRSQAGAGQLAIDALLCRTAEAWALSLAQAGAISHRGSDGSRALDRYRMMGGTEARVGEILGAGDSLSQVEDAWEKSASHRGLSIKPYWTHVGWGMARSGAKAVWVVLFCEKLVDGLSIHGESGGGLFVSGRLLASGDGAPQGPRTPRLISGLLEIPPYSWDRSSGLFEFRVSAAQSAGYIRLGYLGDEGGFRLTNAFTWPRGTEYPEGSGRF